MQCYDELRGLAHQQVANEPPGCARGATSLVHEAYARIVAGQYQAWDNARQFVAAMVRTMRCVRIDDGRKRNRAKRGGGQQRRPLDEGLAVFDPDPAETLAIGEALRKLNLINPRAMCVVVLRYLAGVTVEEAAEVLGVSRRTVNADWQFARAWLHRELTRGDTR